MPTDHDVQVTVAFEAAEATLKRMFEELPKRFRSNLSSVGRYVMGRFTVARLSGGAGLRRRSGTLARSFRFDMHGTELDDLELRFYSTAFYAPIQERGKVIRPRRAKALAIPFESDEWHPVLTPSGDYKIGRGPLRQTLPAAFPSYRFFAAKGMLFGKEEGKDPKPFFWLRKVVKIPPNLRFEKTITGHLRRFLAALTDTAEDVVSGK